MPDPHKSLAPIIEPSAPPLLPQAASAWPDLMLTGLIIVLIFGLLLWLWRRHAPLRALHRIVRLSDARLAGDQLAGWVRTNGICPTPAWLSELDRLRFGPPQADAAARLASLCQDIDRHSRLRRNDGG